MSALFILIGIAYFNGEPVKTEAGDVYKDEAACIAEAKSNFEHAKGAIPKEIQVVYQCVDISQTKPAVSGFGQAANL